MRAGASVAAGCRVQNDRGRAVRVTQGINTELVQHVRWEACFPQVSIFRIGDADHPVLLFQNIVWLECWCWPMARIEARLVRNQAPHPILRHYSSAFEPLAEEALENILI